MITMKDVVVYSIADLGTASLVRSAQVPVPELRPNPHR